VNDEIQNSAVEWTAMVASVHLFERPCHSGYVYPCSLEDITLCLSCLPEQDLDGIWAVGLVPATRKDGETDGRYYFGAQPTVHLFSYPDTLRFKLRAHTTIGDIERGLAVQRQYGMEVERQESRYVCVWSLEHLRRFVVEHVLLHEVGHHVFFWQRQQQGYPYCPNVAGAEQFAEEYALRWQYLMAQK
jgi:hypothetical protein